MTEPTQERYRILIIVVITMVNRSTSNMIQTSAPLFSKYLLRTSDFQISLMIMMANLAAIASLTYFSRNKVQPMKLIFYGTVIIASSLPFFILVNSIFALTVVYALISFWTAALPPLLLTAVILISTKEELLKNIGIFSASLSLSLIIGPTLQAIILTLTGNNLLLSILVFFPLTMFSAILSYLIKDKQIEAKLSRLDFGLLKNRSYWLGVLSSISFSVPFLAIVSFGGIVFKETFGATYSQIEVIFLIFFLSSLTVRLSYGRIRPPKFRIAISSFILAAFGLLLLFFSKSILDLGLSVILLGCSHGVGLPLSAIYIVESVDKSSLSNANSFASLVSNLIRFLFAPLLGIVAELYGAIVVFAISILPVLVIGSIFGLLVVIESRHRNSSSTSGEERNTGRSDFQT